MVAGSSYFLSFCAVTREIRTAEVIERNSDSFCETERSIKRDIELPVAIQDV